MRELYGVRCSTPSLSLYHGEWATEAEAWKAAREYDDQHAPGCGQHYVVKLVEQPAGVAPKAQEKSGVHTSERVHLYPGANPRPGTMAAVIWLEGSTLKIELRHEAAWDVEIQGLQPRSLKVSR